MPPNVVLVTGVSGDLGGRLLARLGRDPDIERVIGVDTSPPRRAAVGDLGRAEFARVDIRNPLISKVITSARVDTVVHAGTACPAGAPVRAAVRKEVNVIGTMRLLAACQRAPALRKLVVASTAAVYGADARSRAVFTEDAELIPSTTHGPAKDAVEVEGYVRGFARRRPDVTVSTARFVDLVGAGVDTVFTRWLALPAVPTALGFDARLQLLHVDDALAVLEQAARHERPGVVNVGGDGVLTLSQTLRRAQRIGAPVPRSLLPAVGRVLRGANLVDLSTETARFLSFGRVVDTTRLTGEFGYTPRWSTREALDEHVHHRPAGAPLGGGALAGMLDPMRKRRTAP